MQAELDSAAPKKALGREKGIGLYGFTKPQKGSLLPPVSYYLEQPLDSLSGDDKNIGYLARVYNGISF